MRHAILLTPLLAACRSETPSADETDAPEATDATDAAADTGPFFGPAVDCGPRTEPDEALLPRWPYLQDVRPDRATIAWGVAPGTSTALTWGPDAAADRRGTPGEVKTLTQIEIDLHHVVLTDLEPGTEYCYGLTVGGQTAAAGLRFRTAPASPQAQVRFVVIGDFGNGSEAQAQLAAVLEEQAADADFWFTTGDNAYGEGTEVQFQEHVFEVYERLWTRAPVYPTPGNHDWKTLQLQPYKDSFFLPVSPPEDRPFEHEVWYGFDWGPVRIAGLDSEVSMYLVTDDPEDGDQLDFVRDFFADDATTGGRWRLAGWHYPVYSGQPDREPSTAVWSFLRPAVEAAAVDLVLTGHNHMYERFLHIRDDEKLESGGTSYVLTAGGGAGLYELGPHPLQDVRAGVHHAVIVDAGPCRLDGRAIDLDGEVIDTWSLTRCE